MDKIIEIAFGFSMLGFVIGSMVTLGLGLTITQIIAPYKKIKIVLLALIANFILVPIFAFFLVQWLPMPEGVRIGLILLSLSGGAPFIPLIVAVAKGDVGGSVGLMVLLLLVTILFMPFAVPFLLPGTLLSALDIAKVLVTIMLIPLIIALCLNAYLPNAANCLQSYTRKITGLSVFVLIVSVIYLYTDVIVSHVDILAVLVLFFLGAAIIGAFMGGRSNSARVSLVVGTGLRNPPVAILVASQSFSTEPMAAIVPLLLAIVAVLMLLPWAKVVSRSV
ncbi:MAG: hypothetical protein PSN04_03505 [Methyloprofundus sp.]|nr:hypothetical protein [Methyloprofundus sp.]